MELALESGRVMTDPTEADLRSAMADEQFAILGTEPDTYIQCAAIGDQPGHYILEYQDGSLDRHYQAGDGPITMDRVLSAFTKYLRRDASWLDDFRWEPLDL